MRAISTLEPTRYEIVVQSRGVTFLLCYRSGSPSRSGLIQVVRDRAREILDACGLSDEAEMTVRGSGRAVAVEIGDPGSDARWIAKYSGRTQRDVRALGDEREFLGNLAGGGAAGVAAGPGRLT